MPTAPPGPLVINHTVEPTRRHDPYHWYCTIHLYVRSLRTLLAFLSLSVKPPKQRERYTITNKASLSIYFYALYFNLSKL
jgi:hypothetical protein